MYRERRARACSLSIRLMCHVSERERDIKDSKPTVSDQTRAELILSASGTVGAKCLSKSFLSE
jgi:hypothetical protein